MMMRQFCLRKLVIWYFYEKKKYHQCQYSITHITSVDKVAMLFLTNIFFSPIEFISDNVLICNPPQKEDTVWCCCKKNYKDILKFLEISV